MKAIFYLSVMTVMGVLLSGCAGVGSGLVLDTVGPDPSSIISTNAGSGTLTVFSAYKVNADFNTPDPNRKPFSDYKILDSNKKLVERVHNITENMLEGPVTIELPAGKYFVVARSNGYGVVTVPVIIAANENTAIHLNGADSWPDESAFNSGNAVCLPDGQIVGWKVRSNF